MCICKSIFKKILQQESVNSAPDTLPGLATELIESGYTVYKPYVHLGDLVTQSPQADVDITFLDCNQIESTPSRNNTSVSSQPFVRPVIDPSGDNSLENSSSDYLPFPHIVLENLDLIDKILL